MTIPRGSGTITARNFCFSKYLLFYLPAYQANSAFVLWMTTLPMHMIIGYVGTKCQALTLTALC